jgi:CRISPR-associated protein (TIGR03986 family)
MLRAPYTFIPLSAWVYQPPWKDAISHDLPFSDGLSGSFDIEVNAHTPILCGGEVTEEEAQHNGQGFQCRMINFFKLPTGKHAILGSSLRGAVRNVIEIAAFGRMQFVDSDRRFGIRDLVPKVRAVYQDKLVRKVSGPSGRTMYLRPQSEAGFLYLDRTGATPKWRIEPCSYARLPYAEINAITGLPPATWSGAEQNVRNRYDAYTASGRSLNQSLFVSLTDGPHPHGGALPGGGSRLAIHYRKAFQTARTTGPDTTGTSPQPGQIVFTGKPSSGFGPRAKKLEFFFYDRRPAKTMDVPDDVLTGFQAIHQAAEDPGLWNKSWRYWLEQLETSPTTRIPVFYLMQGGRLASFGLAMMFKLAHAHTIKDLINNTRRVGQPKSDHLNDDVVDLATAIFGAVRGEKTIGQVSLDRGFKGRVSFSPAILTTPEHYQEYGPLALMQPKPQFYPAYVRQPRVPGGNAQLQGNGFASYTSTAGAPELQFPEIAGWKVFSARASAVAGPLQPHGADGPADIGNLQDVLRKLRPLSQGAKFKGWVRFHNLRPFELGALLWAIEWGGEEALRHRIGMGKPLGLGSVGMRISNLQIEPNQIGSAGPDKSALIREFCAEMEVVYAAAAGRPDCKWLSSEQLIALLASARPPAVDRQHAYMNVEQHQNVKREGDLPELPPALRTLVNTDQRVFGRNHLAPPAPGQPPAGAGPVAATFQVGDKVRDLAEQLEAEVIGLTRDPRRVKIKYLVDGEELVVSLNQLRKL